MPRPRLHHLALTDGRAAGPGGAPGTRARSGAPGRLPDQRGLRAASALAAENPRIRGLPKRPFCDTSLAPGGAARAKTLIRKRGCAGGGSASLPLMADAIRIFDPLLSAQDADAM